MSNYIAISSYGSISALGFDEKEISQKYQDNKTYITTEKFNEKIYPVGRISPSAEEKLKQFISQYPQYKRYDRTTLLAIIAAEIAFEKACWKENLKSSYRIRRRNPKFSNNIGISIGSSRGATISFEKYHKEFLSHPERKVSMRTSPLTTLGNISSSVADFLHLKGFFTDNSVTCSTALQSIANAVAWLKAGMCDYFLAGASEAPLTDFTLAQMDALKIYSSITHQPTANSQAFYPCRPFSSEKTDVNTMVLGEGAAVFVMTSILQLPSPDRKGAGGEVILESIGYSYERPPSLTGITTEGTAFQKSMQMALQNMSTKHPIDLIITHSPGTVNGDNAELTAIKRVFGKNIPNITCNKWKIGHTFGASAAHSLELAILCIRHNKMIGIPYPNLIQNRGGDIKKVLINAAGFGGNSASIIVSSPVLFQ